MDLSIVALSMMASSTALSTTILVYYLVLKTTLDTILVEEESNLNSLKIINIKIDLEENN